LDVNKHANRRIHARRDARQHAQAGRPGET
jgi:hypothetical protein